MRLSPPMQVTPPRAGDRDQRQGRRSRCFRTGKPVLLEPFVPAYIGPDCLIQ